MILCIKLTHGSGQILWCTDIQIGHIRNMYSFYCKAIANKTGLPIQEVFAKLNQYVVKDK